MRYHQIIYLVHVFFVCPLLMYAGYLGHQLSSNKKNKQIVFDILLIVGLVVGLYHGWKLITTY